MRRHITPTCMDTRWFLCRQVAAQPVWVSNLSAFCCLRKAHLHLFTLQDINSTEKSGCHAVASAAAHTLPQQPLQGWSSSADGVKIWLKPYSFCNFSTYMTAILLHQQISMHTSMFEHINTRCSHMQLPLVLQRRHKTIHISANTGCRPTHKYTSNLTITEW